MTPSIDTSKRIEKTWMTNGGKPADMGAITLLRPSAKFPNPGLRIQTMRPFEGSVTLRAGGVRALMELFAEHGEDLLKAFDLQP